MSGKNLPLSFVAQSKFRIVLAKHHGMCFGVRDALAQAEELAARGPLTILGELVHNPIVQRRLAAQGIRQSTGSAEAVNGTAMITAHGTSNAQRAAWEASGLVLANGTCPLV